MKLIRKNGEKGLNEECSVIVIEESGIKYYITPYMGEGIQIQKTLADTMPMDADEDIMVRPGCRNMINVI